MKIKFGGWGWLCGALPLVIVLPACGFKSLPLPPQDLFPAPITDLRFELEATKVSLSWSIPQRTKRGEPLAGVEGYQLFRGEVANAEYCATCPVPYTLVAEVTAAQVTAGKGLARYSEPLLHPGSHYTYKVRANTGWRLAGDDSNPVSFAWLAPAGEPRQVTIQAEEKGLTLSWQPPESFTDGTPITAPLLYRVARSTAGGEYRPLAESPQAELSFHDQGLQNGQPYSYTVTALRPASDTTLVPGLPSGAVVGTPRDLTPPAPPSELSLVSLEQAVRISWGLDLEEDLAGYRVYRRLATATTAELLATVPAREITFIDRHLPAAAERWFYSVTALDRAEPPNESAPSPELDYTAEN